MRNAVDRSVLPQQSFSFSCSGTSFQAGRLPQFPYLCLLVTAVKYLSTNFLAFVGYRLEENVSSLMPGLCGPLWHRTLTRTGGQLREVEFRHDYRRPVNMPTQ